MSYYPKLFSYLRTTVVSSRENTQNYVSGTSLQYKARNMHVLVHFFNRRRFNGSRQQRTKYAESYMHCTNLITTLATNTDYYTQMRSQILLAGTSEP
jgi:hypothetical protein